MPLSQILQSNLVFRTENVGLEFMTLGRSKVSRYKMFLFCSLSHSENPPSSSRRITRLSNR